jgi:chorismate mutase
MIETHPDPPNALSDARQQIKPAQLAELLTNLKPRNTNGVSAAPEDPLQQLRNENNAVDYEILEALARRQEIIRQIGEYKKSKNMTIFQPKRWRQVVEDRVEKGESLGLDENFIKDVYQLIHNYSVKIQTEIINSD